MQPSPLAGSGQLVLGVEGGGTRTQAVLVDSRGGVVLDRSIAGCGNVRLLDDRQLRALFRRIRAACAGSPEPVALGIGMAGARTAADRRRIVAAAGKVWGGLPCFATNDLETALAANETPQDPSAARILVLSGTGSCCFGRDRRGRSLKVGGWGHVLGDQGSGYDIGLRALRAVLAVYDESGLWPSLGARLLRALQLNTPEDLVGWAQTASKAQVAALATEVFAAARDGERAAKTLRADAARCLAANAVACARRLAGRRDRVHFVLAGGVLLHQPALARAVSRLIRLRWTRADVRLSRWPGALGAARLAAALVRQTPTGVPTALPTPALEKSERGEAGRLEAPANSVPIPTTDGLPPTECRNPRSLKLDRLPLAKAIRLMLQEEQRVPAAVLGQARHIERALRLIVASFRHGGRLFYVGAGTSGRLGVLDASECPPTFRVSPRQVQGILAGAPAALWQSIEGAEDDADAGAEAVRFRGVDSGDVVVGIAASGRTPFVWGALAEARRCRARTVLLCFNPRLRFAKGNRPDVVIAADTGPEVLTGSTRLKAGTGTKLVLNTLTTLAMVRTGKVVGNLMVDLNPSNAKLRDRAVRIVRTLTGAGDAAARRALVKSGWVVKQALRRLRRG